ncbi:hypothetical protein [Thermoactinospora rubra]|uniref:hypothetical protein n=1 Tax=Thermoactinospora rubra TaxID=1088767 RepID=UPI000A10FB20|nr:hypothetical protein [Thermoactinospora rubra]
MREPAAAPGALAEAMGHAVHRLRHRYVLWGRLCVRFGVAAVLAAEPSTPWQLAGPALAGCAAYDVLVARRLRRSGRARLWPRAVADVADAAAWSLVVGFPYDAAVLITAPLALEAGLRRGRPALLLPLLVGAAIAALLLAAGRPPGPAPVLWPVATAGAGLAAARYLAARLAVLERLARARVAAEAGTAELAGQNSVAMGADSVVDVLARTAPLLAVPGRAAVPSPLPAWKAALAESCSRQATYLGTALLRWQRVHNARSPWLAADADLRPSPGAGTLLLTTAQVTALERLLDAASPSGVVVVDVPEPRPVGGEQRLLLNGTPLVVPADAAAPVRLPDLGPIAFLLAAAGALCHSLPSFEAVPPAVTVPVAALEVGAAWWAHRRTRPPAALVTAGLALGAVDAIASTAGMVNTETSGVARLPFELFLLWFGPLLALHWRDLPPGRRAALLLGTAAVLGAGFALLPPQVSPGLPAAFPVWPAMAVLAAGGLRDAMDQDAAALASALARDRRAVVDEAFQRGRRLVLDLATAEAVAVWERFMTVRDRLAPAVAAEVERRLAEVGDRLARMRGGMPICEDVCEERE